MGKDVADVQLVPPHSSTVAIYVGLGLNPPMLTAAAVVPKPEFDLVAVFKELGDVVQDDPSQVSVCVDGPPGASPPNAIAAVELPVDPKVFLAVFKSPTSVHDEPSYDSVFPVLGASPPIANAAV